MSGRFSSKQAVAAALVVGVAGFGVWYWTSGRTEAPVAEGSATSAAPLVDPAAAGPASTPGAPPLAATQSATNEVSALPPVRPSRFQNTVSATFVGRDACADCHQDVHESFLKTAHARALHEADPVREPPDGEFDDPVSGRSYQVYREAEQLRHREILKIGDDQELELADHAVRYVVGSGDHAHTFLVETAAGFLAESPVSWYASRESWDLSPGFERNNTGFGRAVYAECLFCHAGRSEPENGNRGRVKIHTQSIDCERCHGPGSLHVERQNASADDSSTDATSDIDLTIVNPAHLPRAQNEAICAQCHLDTVAEVSLRGRSVRDFRPGDWMEDYRVHYGLQVPNTGMRVVGHIEQLRLSSCYRGSETLTCITCHDAHRVLAEEERLDFYRAKCLDCHSQQPCGLPEAKRLEKSAQDDCMACHMPTSSTDVLHVAATHHRIAIHNEEPAAADRRDMGDLIPLGDISHLPKLEQDRCQGLGYLRVSLVEGDPRLSEAYRVRSRDMLEDVKVRGLQDPVVDAALAKIYQRENPPKAIQLAESALRSASLQPDTRTNALFALSSSYLSLKQTALAIQPLEQLVQVRRQAGDWFLLGVCRYQAGDIEAALQAARRAVEIRPDKANYQALLAELYMQKGDSDLANKHQQLAKLLAAPRPPAP